MYTRTVNAQSLTSKLPLVHSMSWAGRTMPLKTVSICDSEFLEVMEN